MNNTYINTILNQGKKGINMLDVFGLFKVDTLYVVIGLLVITIVAIVLAIVAICKACAMMKKYDMMMALMERAWRKW